MGGGAAAGRRAPGWRGPRRPREGCPRRPSQPALLTPFPSPWRGSKGLSRPRATVSAAPSSRRDRRLRDSAPARSRRCAAGAPRASRRHPPPPGRPHPCLPIASRPPSLPAPAGSAPRWRGLRGAWRRPRTPHCCLGPGPEGHPGLGHTLGPLAWAPRKVFFFFPLLPVPLPHALPCVRPGWVWVLWGKKSQVPTGCSSPWGQGV